MDREGVAGVKQVLVPGADVQDDRDPPVRVDLRGRAGEAGGARARLRATTERDFGEEHAHHSLGWLFPGAYAFWPARSRATGPPGRPPRTGILRAGQD